MEPPRQKFSRLVTALGELIEQEASTLAARDFAAVGEIQRRAAPVVAGLAELGPDAADELSRVRIAALLTRRQRSLDLLETQLANARSELEALNEGSRRVTQVSPVYGRSRTAAANTNFRGRG